MTNPSLPYDPDFDGPIAAPSRTPDRGLWNALSAKHAFIAGVLTSLGAVCAVGFFVLLRILLNGTQPFGH